KDSADSEAELVAAVDTQAEEGSDGPHTATALVLQQPAQNEPTGTPPASGDAEDTSSRSGLEVATGDTPGAGAPKRETEEATRGTSSIDASNPEPETAPPSTSAATQGAAEISHQRTSSKLEKK